MTAVLLWVGIRAAPHQALWCDKIGVLRNLFGINVIFRYSFAYSLSGTWALCLSFRVLIYLSP